MATKLFLTRQSAGLPGKDHYKEMLTTAPVTAVTAVTDTVASGTEIIWTNDTTSDQSIAWVTLPLSSGLTLTTSDISIWAEESNMLANCGGGYRLFQLAPDGTETELAGGPFEDGAEFGTSAAEMVWTGNFTDTAFSAGNRVLLKVYVVDVGTMAGGHTCTLTYNAADAATGDSFLNFASETMAFSQRPCRRDSHLLLGVGC